MKDFFKGPFDFDGDGKMDPFELGTKFMIFEECTKEEEEDEDWDNDDDDWEEKDDWDEDEEDDDWTD